MGNRLKDLTMEVKRCFNSTKVPECEPLRSDLIDLTSWEIEHLQSVSLVSSIDSAIAST